jgi:hypothetical protein
MVITAKTEISNELIVHAIEASISFEALMDTIDFNSYLPNEKNNNKTYKIPLYKDYLDSIKLASRICNTKFSEDSDKLSHYLVKKLFEGKKKRLEDRKQVNFDDEKKILIDATNLLQEASLRIQDKNIQKPPNSIIDNNILIKVLYFNELSICYSGLIKSTMSLGYAQESLGLLEKFYPEMEFLENPNNECEKDNLGSFLKRFNEMEDNILPSHILNLYTFALFNKGEAARLLNEKDSSLKSFKRIINICKKVKKNRDNIILNDYNPALLRSAMILLDLGRGKEAIDFLNDVTDLDIRNHFTQEKEIELGSAYIDKKEYTEAFKHLNVFRNNEWKNTFTYRKAEISILRLVEEYKENLPKDFSNNLPETRVIFNEYRKFGKTSKKILLESIRRKDGDSFKKICLKLADHYSKSEEEKVKEKALAYYYLYLFECKRLLIGFLGKIEKFVKDETLGILFNLYPDFNPISELSQIRNDDKYLKKFFDGYIDWYKTGENTIKSDERHFIAVTSLKTRLTDIFYQKDKDIELEQVKKNYDYLVETINNKNDINKVSEIKSFLEPYYFKNSKEGMNSVSITDQMHKNTSAFVKKVIGATKMNINGINEGLQGTLSILRRWNSFTPTLSSSISRSKGGGYFLRFYDSQFSVGIVVDPGYDFLENFFSQGFKIGDIDLVLVSHSHPDHTHDLAPLLSLFHARNSKLGSYNNNEKINKKTVTLILSPGVFEHYNSVIGSSDTDLKDIIVVEIKDYDLISVYKDKLEIYEIEAFGTTHEDLSQYQSLGFKITVKKGGRETVVGFTGDIKWKLKDDKYPNYITHLSNCNIICAHLGSIINILDKENFCTPFCYVDEKHCEGCNKDNFEKLNITQEKTLNQTRKENHLYLAGMAYFFKYLSNNHNMNLKLAIISEFGEELKQGIRIDLHRKFDLWFKDLFQDNIEKPKCLPGDIGLEVDAFTGNVFCHCCKRYVKGSNIVPVAYGKEESICFVCKECQSVLSSYQIDQMLKEYCENGRQLESVYATNS